jgi:hypothetical protein
MQQKNGRHERRAQFCHTKDCMHFSQYEDILVSKHLVHLQDFLKAHKIIFFYAWYNNNNLFFLHLNSTKLITVTTCRYIILDVRITKIFGRNSSSGLYTRIPSVVETGRHVINSYLYYFCIHFYFTKPITVPVCLVI